MATKREIIIKKETLKGTKLQKIGPSRKLGRGSSRPPVGGECIGPSSFDSGSESGRGGGGG